ncbi:hypothetical protein HYDPIDRAFT_80164 [Hydnomerulius pinastri MD-312]|nr:hypothetical protein HYDPIDRAFT_80164 [Hydnomerulius pinastri MD-312]
MPRRANTKESTNRLKQQTLVGFLNSSPPSSPAKLFPTTPGPSKRKRKPPTPSTEGSQSGDGADSADSDVGAIQFEPEVIDVSDGEESPRRPKRRKSQVVTDGLPEHAVSDISLQENSGVPARWKGKKGKAKAVEDSDEESQPRRSKFTKGIRPPTPEEDDVLDDVDENHIIESRFRARDKKTAFQKNLEKLKRKKRSEIALESSSSEGEESEASVVTPFKGAKPHRHEDSDASDDDARTAEDDDDSFIVEDDAHGAPATQLPVAFSMNTHQDLAHHFKIICQLFVHMAVRPLSDRRPFLEHVLTEEEYFSVPLQVTRRKLSGLRDSLVASSVWQPNFKKPLETYPEFSLTRLDFTVPQCDACHLGGRVSTLLGRVSGKPYDRYDFETSQDMTDDESDDSSNDDDDDDEPHGKVRREFHLGRFCAARTQVFHSFNHWEHSLYKSLQREITEAQDKNRKFVRVAFAGGVKPPKDLHDADKVMDWLDQRGIIDLEWQKVRQMMESARNLEISSKRGDVDGLDL